MYVPMSCVYQSWCVGFISDRLGLRKIRRRSRHRVNSMLQTHSVTRGGYNSHLARDADDL